VFLHFSHTVTTASFMTLYRQRTRTALCSNVLIFCLAFIPIIAKVQLLPLPYVFLLTYSQYNQNFALRQECRVTNTSTPLIWNCIHAKLKKRIWKLEIQIHLFIKKKHKANAACQYMKSTAHRGMTGKCKPSRAPKRA